MDFAFTPEQLSFRQEVRDFLDEALTPEEWQAIDDGAEGTYHNRAFSKKLAAKGWIGLSWPKEWGGQAISHMMRLIYYEEMITSKAPIGYHFIAERQMGPSFMLNGTGGAEAAVRARHRERRHLLLHRLQRARRRLRPRRPTDPRRP